MVIGLARASEHVWELPGIMTRLWAGGEGEARRGSVKLVGVHAHRHVLERHGHGLDGSVRCIRALCASTRVLGEVRGGFGVC